MYVVVSHHYSLLSASPLELEVRKRKTKRGSTHPKPAVTHNYHTMESATAAVVSPIAVVQESAAAPAVPVREPFYKSPFAIDSSLVQFTMKPNVAGRAAGPVETTTFSISMRPAPGAPAPVETVAPAPKRGARAGAAPRGPMPPKMGHLAIKPVNPLRTKYGISVASQDKAMISHLRENPRKINAMAAGICPTPPGVHFEILFFLDLTKESDRRLEELSDESRDSFIEYLRSGRAPGVSAGRGLIVNGFVRTSERTDERYIVCSMSTMHTVGQNKFYPTPFYSKTSDSILWSEIVHVNFCANIEFKVNHVVLVGTGRAAFKSYISSCQLIENPVTSLSEERQGQEAYAEKMKAAALKEEAEAIAAGASPAQMMTTTETLAVSMHDDDGVTDHDELATQLAELQLKARESNAPVKARKTVAKPVAAAVPTPKPKKKLAAPAPPPPPADEEDEEIDEDADVVPTSHVVNLRNVH